MPIHYAFENCDHGLIVKIVDCESVEVTQKSGRDGIATAACGRKVAQKHNKHNAFSEMNDEIERASGDDIDATNPGDPWLPGPGCR